MTFLRRSTMTLTVGVLLLMASSSSVFAQRFPLRSVHIESRRDVKPIPSPTQNVESRLLRPGQTKVVKKGQPGALVIVFRQLWVDGKLAGEKEVSRTRREPTPTIIEVARSVSAPSRSGVPARTLVKNASAVKNSSVLKNAPSSLKSTPPQTKLQISYGAEVGFSLKAAKVMTFESTAYLPTDGGGQGITKTGRRATLGIVAVDPRVIPLNSIVFVEGYGWAVAADTGGRIKGRIVDVCILSRSEAMQWGRRQVKVFVFPTRITRDLP